MPIVDVHAHIFPDKIAEKATRSTAEYFPMKEPPSHNGTVQQLVDTLWEAGIDYALVFSAATTETQVEHVNRYLYTESLKHPEFLPCGSIHAAYPKFEEELSWLCDHGMHGIKLHPEFQKFPLNDRRLFPIFEVMAEKDMFLIAHMGDPRVEVSGPERMVEIATTFPRLRCIACHLGDWGEWDRERILPLTKLSNVYTDISSTFSYTDNGENILSIIRSYDPDRIFWGSDYPIWCPKKELRRVRELPFSEDFVDKLLFQNFKAFYHYQNL